MFNHRGECSDPDCTWMRRENCSECLEDLADKHMRETGHKVELRVTAPVSMGELCERINFAQPSVLRAALKRRGW